MLIPKPHGVSILTITIRLAPSFPNTMIRIPPPAKLMPSLLSCNHTAPTWWNKRNGITLSESPTRQERHLYQTKPAPKHSQRSPSQQSCNSLRHDLKARVSIFLASWPVVFAAQSETTGPKMTDPPSPNPQHPLATRTRSIRMPGREFGRSIIVGQNTPTHPPSAWNKALQVAMSTMMSSRLSRGDMAAEMQEQMQQQEKTTIRMAMAIFPRGEWQRLQYSYVYQGGTLSNVTLGSRKDCIIWQIALFFTPLRFWGMEDHDHQHIAEAFFFYLPVWIVSGHVLCHAHTLAFRLQSIGILDNKRLWKSR